MRKIKKVLLIIIAIFIIAISVYAEENVTDSVSVQVIKSQNGIKTTIYTGLLSEYDNGRWAHLDSSVSSWTIINTATMDEEVLYIIRTSNVPDIVSEASQNTKSVPFNLLPDDSVLDISSQIKLNGVNVGEAGVRIVDNSNLNCSYTILNNSENKQNISLILATYTADKKLHHVKTSNIEINGGESSNVELIYQFDEEYENSGKIMLWDSLTGMLPIHTVIDFTQNDGVNAYYYNADNRLLQIDKINGASIVFTYDNMGNLLTKTTK